MQKKYHIFKLGAVKTNINQKQQQRTIYKNISYTFSTRVLTARVVFTTAFGIAVLLPTLAFYSTKMLTLRKKKSGIFLCRLPQYNGTCV